MMSYCENRPPVEGPQKSETKAYPVATAAERLGAMFRLIRWTQPEREGTLVLRLREKIIIAMVMGALTWMLGIINTNVNFLVRVMPAKVQELERKQLTTDETVKALQAEQKLDNEHKGRVIGILERHEDRLKRLEGDR